MKVVGLGAALGTLNGTTPVAFRVRADIIADPFAVDLPIGARQGGFLDRVEANYSGLPGAPAAITAHCVLTWDAAGDELASNEITQVIRRGFTTATDGGAVFSIAGDFPLRDGATNGELWAWLWTATVGANPATVVRVYFRDEVL